MTTIIAECGHMMRGPGDVAATGASVETLIRWAYGIGDDRGTRRPAGDENWQEGPVPFGWVEGVPGWDEVYDVRAKTPRPYVIPGPGNLGEVHEMVRSLLADRFQFQAHWETRPTVDYELTILDEGLGPRIRPSPDCPSASGEGARRLSSAFSAPWNDPCSPRACRRSSHQIHRACRT